MKNIFLILVLFISLSCCKTDDDNNDTLPPATQTGAGTFACYVNGTSYIDTSGGYFNCFYQLIDGEYFFSISGEVDSQGLCDIQIGSRAVEINEGETYTLLSDGAGNTSANIFFCNELQDYETSSEYSGQLSITKLDFENNIVSGTFYFTILNTHTNTEYNITDGRFDTLFTQ